MIICNVVSGLEKSTMKPSLPGRIIMHKSIMIRAKLKNISSNSNRVTAPSIKAFSATNPSKKHTDACIL